MTKLKDKLKELGYQDALFLDRDIYFKWFNDIWRISFEIDNGTIKDVTLGIGTHNVNKEELNEDEYLLNAYNEMRKDLEILKEIENE